MRFKFKVPTFDKLESKLKNTRRVSVSKLMNDIGKTGVQKLMENTPKNTGKSAMSWSYSVIQKGDIYSLIWSNSNVVESIPLVVLIDLGHRNRDGSFQTGVNFINPTIQPLIEDLRKQLSKEFNL